MRVCEVCESVPQLQQVYVALQGVVVYPRRHPGDHVLVKQPRANKTTPQFNPEPYTVVQKKGSMVTAQRGSSRIVRNSSHFKAVPGYIPAQKEEEEKEEEEAQHENEGAEDEGAEDEPVANTPPLQTPSPTSPRPVSTPSGPTPRSTCASPCQVPSCPASTGSNPKATPARVSRPARIQKAPAYLKDYVMP